MAAHFGLDIGSYSIKLIQASRAGEKFSLVSVGEVRTPADLNSDAEKDKTAFVNAIKNLVVSSKVTTKNVALALSELNVYSQVIEMPPLSQTELASAINFEAEQYIPVPLEEVNCEYLILKSPTRGSLNEKMEILLVAAKKNALAKVVNIVSGAGLNPISVETEMLAIIRSVAKPEIKKCQLIIDIGNRSSDIIILKDNNLKLTRTIPTGGEAISRAVASAFNLNLTQAEQYKVSYGIDATKLEGNVAKAIFSTLNVILAEVKRSLIFFNQKNPEAKVELIILSGGSAEMPGLSSFFAKSINLEVLMADPFEKFIKSPKFPNITGIPRFSVASGLAQREDD